MYCIPYHGVFCGWGTVPNYASLLGVLTIGESNILWLQYYSTIFNAAIRAIMKRNYWCQYRRRSYILPGCSPGMAPAPHFSPGSCENHPNGLRTSHRWAASCRGRRKAGCQKFGPFLGPWSHMASNSLGTQWYS